MQRLLHRGLQRGRGLLQQLLHTPPSNIFNRQPEFDIPAVFVSCDPNLNVDMRGTETKIHQYNSIRAGNNPSRSFHNHGDHKGLAALRIYVNQTILLVCYDLRVRNQISQLHTVCLGVNLVQYK